MKYHLYFDGLCEPVNPGGHGCCGWVINNDAGAEVNTGHCHRFRSHDLAGEQAPMTNNVAEYMALWEALRQFELPELKDVDALVIHGDSKLVIEQITDGWQCKAPALKILKAAVLARLAELVGRRWVAKWIPREQNTQADELSRTAYLVATGSHAPDRSK